MKKPTDQIIVNFGELEEISNLMDLAGMNESPIYNHLFQVACSRSRHAPAAINRLRRIAICKVNANRFAPQHQKAWPQVPPDRMIVIGTNPDTGNPVFIDYDHLPLKTVFIGGTGSGKTCTSASLIKQLIPRLHGFCVDSKLEAFRFGRQLGVRFLYAKPSQIFMNELEPVGPDPHLWFGTLMELYAYLLGIDGKTWPELTEILNGIWLALPATAPMISLIEFICVLEKIADAEGKTKFATAAAKFRVLASAYGRRARVRRGPDLFARYPFIGIDFSDSSHQVRNVVQGVMLKIQMQKISIRGHSSDPSFVFIRDEGLDDASTDVAVRPGKVEFQETLASQGRSFGVSPITLFQDPSQPPGYILTNTGNFIAMRVLKLEHAKECSRLLGHGDDYAKSIQMLEPGEGFLRSPHFPQGVHFVADYNDLGEYPSTDEIAASMSSELQWIEDNTEFSPEETFTVSTRNYAEILGIAPTSNTAESTPPAATPPSTTPVSAAPAVSQPPRILGDWVVLLEDIIKDPNAALTSHYKAVKFGGAKGTRVKDELISNGLSEIKIVHGQTGSPRKVLTITKLGRQTLKGLKT